MAREVPYRLKDDQRMRMSNKLSSILQDPISGKDLLKFLMKNLSPLDRGEFIEYKGCKIGYVNRGDDYVLDIVDMYSELPSHGNQNVAIGRNNRVQGFTAYSGSVEERVDRILEDNRKSLFPESFVGAPISGITSAPTIIVKPQEESIPQPSHTPMIEDIKVELVKHQHNI